MPLLLGSLLALSMVHAAPAATGRLSGQVTAQGTNAPVAGARVMVFPMMRPTPMRTTAITVPPAGITDESGRFVDESGAPIARAMVMLLNDPRSGGMIAMGPGGNAQTGEDGRFSIGDVVYPGRIG